MKRFKATSLVLGLLCLMYLITYIDRVNVSMAASAFGQEFHLSKTEIGLVFSAFAWPYLLFQVIGGWVGDRFGPRRTLLVCGLIWAVATIATGLVGGLGTMIAARVMLGFGEGATFPVATRAMSIWLPAKQRGWGQGITHACARVGNALTPPLVAFLMAYLTWRGAFVVLGVVSLAWAVVWGLYFRDDPATHAAITREELAALPKLEHGRARPATPWGPLVRRMWPVTLVYFCYGWTFWLFLSWIPLYFLNVYHLKIADSAIFSSGVFFAGVVGDALGGVASDALLRRTGSVRTARIGVVMVGLLGALVSLVPTMFTSNIALIALCLSAGLFFCEICIGPMWAIPMDIAPRFAGTASGLMNTGSAAAAIVSPVVAGWIIDATGNWNLPFVGSMVLLLVGAALALRMRPEESFEVPTPARAAAGLATAD